MQTLDHSNATSPWFGGNLPDPYHLRFKEKGQEVEGSLGRSDLSWAADNYSNIGKPTNPEAKHWWKCFKNFISKNSVQVPWTASSRIRAYMFPEAAEQIKLGRHKDINPH